MVGSENVVLIIPGRRELVDSRTYRDVGDIFESNSITPLFIQPHWKGASVTELLEETATKIVQEIEKRKYREIHGFGFSLGAMLLLLGARNIRLTTSILCSMSFFKEEIPHMGRVLKLFTKHIVYAGDEPFSYPEVSPAQKFIFLYGEKELRSIPSQIIKMREDHFRSEESVVAKSSGHNLGHAGYQLALREVAGSIK